MSDELQFFFVHSLFCPFSDWTGSGMKFYNIVNFKSLIRKPARIELPSAILLSALLRSDIS